MKKFGKSVIYQFVFMVILTITIVKPSSAFELVIGEDTVAPGINGV